MDSLNVEDLDAVPPNQAEVNRDKPKLMGMRAASTAIQWREKIRTAGATVHPELPETDYWPSSALQQVLAPRLQADEMVGYRTHHLSRTGRHLRQPFFTNSNIMRIPLWRLLVIFALANWLCVVVFAALYYSAGESCFILSSGFSFWQILCLSIHVFTTVGFGTDSPSGSCVGPQLLVFLEHFVGLIDIALFTAIILTKLVQPHPIVKFSDKYIVAEEADGQKWLTFRMVRVSPYQLRDCEIAVQCGIVTREDGGVTGCYEEPLSLQCATKSNLETWFVRHLIDDTSPLKAERVADLAYINVKLTVFDTAFVQEVRLYHNYTPGTDMVRNATFSTMKYWKVQNLPDKQDGGSAGGTTTKATSTMVHQLEHIVDHSQLNAYESLPV